MDKKKSVKQTFGKVARHGGVWFAALVGTTFGVGELVDRALEQDPSTNGTSYQAVQNFEERMSDLKVQKAELDLAYSQLATGEENTDGYKFLKQNYQEDVYEFLADVIVDDDGSSLSEVDKADLLNSFHNDVDNLGNFGFAPVTEKQAGYLNDFTVAGDNDNLVSKVDKAQGQNGMAIAGDMASGTWEFMAMMLWALMFFPGLRQWKDSKTLKRLEDPLQRNPKYKH